MTKPNGLFASMLTLAAALLAAAVFSSPAYSQETEQAAPADEPAVEAEAAPAPAKAAEKPKRPRASKRSEAAATRQDLVLAVGVLTTVDLPFEPCPDFERCVDLGNKTLVQLEYLNDKRQLAVRPAKKGETTITFRDKSGDIRLIINAVVSDTNIARRLAELRELFRDIEGIDLRIMGDKIVIDGEVVVLSDFSRIFQVTGDESYKALILNLVTLSPVGLQIMAQKIQAEINKPEVRVRVLNGFFLLEGQVENIQERQAIESVATGMLQGYVVPTYYMGETRTAVEVKPLKIASPIINKLAISQAKPKPPEKMVRVTIDFVELAKDYMRNFGFSWIPSLDGGGQVSFGQSTTGGVTSQGSGSLSGTIGNLFPKLSSAQEAGYARILEESVMIVKTGQDAKLDRRVSFPLQTQSSRGEVDYKLQEIGPRLHVKPSINPQTEDVDLFIDFSYAGIAGKTPTALIVQKHDYQTQLVVRNGESAAIVNAISNTISTAFNKDFPGTGKPQNPLFILLRSKAFQKQKSQFVVFVTPQIIDSSSTATEDIKQKYGLKKKL